MDDHETLQRRYNAYKKLQEDRYLESCKKRLTTLIQKKIQTTMIGALAEFEQLFGYLWGMGKDDIDLDEDELNFRRQWDKARTEILNNGNSQIRACVEEIAQYTIKWNRYHTEFIVKPKEMKDKEEKNG